MSDGVDVAEKHEMDSGRESDGTERYRSSL
jgi:hypothetical protein